MIKKDFIDTIFAMYPNSFSAKTAEHWQRAYDLALPNDLDYEKLFDWMLVNYNSTSQAPSPAFFSKWIEDYQKAQNNRRNLEQANLERKMREENEKRLEEAEKSLPKNLVILDPLEVLKKCYTTPQAFIDSMIERQKDNPCHKVKGKYIFFTKTEMLTLGEYAYNLKNELAKCLFWRKVISVIGSKTKFDELCKEIT